MRGIPRRWPDRVHRKIYAGDISARYFAKFGTGEPILNMEVSLGVDHLNRCAVHGCDPSVRGGKLEWRNKI